MTMSAVNGADALAAYQAEGADVVISDWMMPGVDGLELCGGVRERIGAPYTYFILLTALGDPDHRLAAIRAGADDYVPKPFSIDDIEARLIVAERVIRVHRRQEWLLRMTRRFAAEDNPERLLEDLLQQAIELLGGSAGAVWRWEQERQVLTPVATAASDGEQLSAVAVPLTHEGRLVGSLAVGLSTDQPARTFTQQDAELLEMLGSTAAAALVALEHARLDGVKLAARTAQHELNNQLAVARGYAEVLAGSPDLPPHLQEIADEVMHAADDAAGVVRQMRNLSCIREQRWNEPGDTTINLSRSQRQRGAA
jgi:CheY-like chemotaxis protein